MRILHILNDVTDKGNGIIHAAIDLAAGQVAIGDTVAIASGAGSLGKLLDEAGIQWFQIDFPRRPAAMFMAVRSFHRVMKKFKPEVIHAHMRTGLVFGLLFSRLYGCKLVGHLHNVHESNSRLMGLADRVIAVSESVASTLETQGIPRKKIRTVLNGPLESPRMAFAAAGQQVNWNTPRL